MKQQIELMNYIMYDYDGPNPDKERLQKEKIYKELMEFERQQKQIIREEQGLPQIKDENQIQIAVDRDKYSYSDLKSNILETIKKSPKRIKEVQFFQNVPSSIEKNPSNFQIQETDEIDLKPIN